MRWVRSPRPAWLLGLGLVLLACSGTATPSPSGGAGPGASPGTSPSIASPPGGSTASGGLEPSGLIAVDQGLLGHLPASIGGIDVSYSGEATAEVRNDPVLAQNASALAYGLAIDPLTGDLVVAAVVRLRPGVFNDEFYRGWRTTYDRAACAQAGGVAGTAEATMGGRRVHIGTCNGGAHTYHVFLELPGVMISATSVGAKRFGEQLAANVRT